VTYEQFNAFCGALHATTYVMQWGSSHVWKVGGKLFAIGGWSKDSEPAFTFKASTLNFEILREQPGFKPAPYLAARGMRWIQQTATCESMDDALKYYIQESHRIVSLGLTKKRQKELSLNQP
jgi:predicted DNA-binding protein (MmcQ/YjbR family)